MLHSLLPLYTLYRLNILQITHITVILNHCTLCRPTLYVYYLNNALYSSCLYIMYLTLESDDTGGRSADKRPSTVVLRHVQWWTKVPPLDNNRQKYNCHFRDRTFPMKAKHRSGTWMNQTTVNSFVSETLRRHHLASRGKRRTQSLLIYRLFAHLLQDERRG